MRISDWSSDVCSSDLGGIDRRGQPGGAGADDEDLAVAGLGHDGGKLLGRDTPLENRDGGGALQGGEAASGRWFSGASPRLRAAVGQAHGPPILGADTWGRYLGALRYAPIAALARPLTISETLIIMYRLYLFYFYLFLYF